MSFKVGMAAIGATALLLFSGYQTIEDGSQLFLTERLPEDEKAFINYI